MSTKQHTSNAEQVVQAVSKTEQFFQKNRQPLIYSGVGIVVVIAVIVAIKLFYINPLKQEAIDQMFVAEQYFRSDDFEKALNGDGNALGFSQIIDEYGKKAGVSALMYAGICELRLENYQGAISYLNKYKTKDPIMGARALCCIGDAYSGSEDYTQAVSYYKKAAAVSENMLSATYLLKAGVMYEELGQPQEAIKMYQEIKDKYPQSYEGMEIDKYIARLKIAM